MSDFAQRKAREQVENLPGFKEDELNKLGNCLLCGKPLLDVEYGGITFYVHTIKRAMWDVDAVRQQAGLGMMLGGAIGLARIMGPDRDLAKVFSEETFAMHEVCGQMATFGKIEMALEGRRENRDKSEGSGNGC